MRNKLTIAVVTMFVLIVYMINAFSYMHPVKYLIEDFSCIEQPDGITCGPTSATMVLNYYGHSVSVDQVSEESKTEWIEYKDESIGMTTPEYIPIALKHFGVPSKTRRGYLPRLKYYVSSGKPCIVLLRSGEFLWHYVVVIGYNVDFIIVADPGSGSCMEMPNEAFVGSWSFKTNMSGENMKNKWAVEALHILEVYPHSMVVPNESLVIDKDI